jgi:hypothetical protein
VYLYVYIHSFIYIFYVGNSNTVGGGLVLPLADLGDLTGLEGGSLNPISMVDGKMYVMFILYM